LSDEKKLIDGLKKRKRGTLEKIIEIYTPYVSAIVYNVIGSSMTKEDIEEAVSDTFVSLWKHSGNLDIQKGNIRTYLGATARNIAKNKLRKAYIHYELDENTASVNTIEENFEHKESQRSMADLIASLGEPDNEIFFRYYYYEERISQISMAMGMSVSAVKTRLSRGRKKLREIILKGGTANE
jgi:RNA polymerase sigma-70 factor (ECF subfamily)